MKDVTVRPSLAHTGEIALALQVGKNARRRPLGDANLPCQVLDQDIGLLGQNDKDMGVVGKERPRPFFICRHIFPREQEPPKRSA